LKIYSFFLFFIIIFLKAKKGGGRLEGICVSHFCLPKVFCTNTRAKFSQKRNRILDRREPNYPIEMDRRVSRDEYAFQGSRPGDVCGTCPSHPDINCALVSNAHERAPPLYRIVEKIYYSRELMVTPVEVKPEIKEILSSFLEPNLIWIISDYSQELITCSAPYLVGNRILEFDRALVGKRFRWPRSTKRPRHR
jgi:hypothetical protein